MRSFLKVLSCAVALGAAVPAQAVTLSFAFSFTNAANGTGLVRGVISGLKDNATGAATSVQIISNDAGAGQTFGIGEYVSPGPGANSFTVVDATLTGFDFQSMGSFNRPPALACCSLSLLNVEEGFVMAGLSGFNGSVESPVIDDFSADLLVDGPGPAPVPLPAPFLMLPAALAGLGWARRPGRHGRGMPQGTRA